MLIIGSHPIHSWRESPTIPELKSNDDFPSSSSPEPHSESPQSYAQVAASPKKIVKSPIPPFRPPVSVNKVKLAVETELQLKYIYVTGLPYQKVGQLRKNMKSLGFYMDSIINLSYLGKTIIECIMKDSDLKRFKQVVKKNKLKVFERFDPCDHTDHSLDVYLGAYKIGLNPSEIRAQFVERIANECLKCEHSLVDKFYREWARRLNAVVQFDQITGTLSSKVT